MSSTADPARDQSVDALVVGGGPAGVATAVRLAASGHRVTLLERDVPPRPKTCGDLLAPRAVHELGRLLGRDPLTVAGAHRIDGLKLSARGARSTLAWPQHPDYPSFGMTTRREQLDAEMLARAEELGVEVLTGHEAVAPIVERGFLRGAGVVGPGGAERTVLARYTVVADGANSRFGRALGTFRTPTWPYAAAVRNYWSSPLHDAAHGEVLLDLVDRNGTPVSGFGWVYPLGDGTVNVGAGVLSTSRDFRLVNTAWLLQEVATQVAGSWQLDPDTPLGEASGGRVPLGGSVGPTAGPTYLVVGDAAGMANPFTGAGIEYALETGRLAAEVLEDALDAGDSTLLQRYPQLVDEVYGTYFKVGRLFDRMVGRPTVMRRVGRAAAARPAVGRRLLRIGTNELTRDSPGLTGALYRAARVVTRFAPDA